MIPEKLALLRFHHFANMTSVVNVLYQLGLTDGHEANLRNEINFYKVMEACSMMSKKDKKKFLINCGGDKSCRFYFSERSVDMC